MILTTTLLLRLRTWLRAWLTPERLNWITLSAVIAGGFMLVLLA